MALQSQLPHCMLHCTIYHVEQSTDVLLAVLKALSDPEAESGEPVVCCFRQLQKWEWGL